MDNNVTLEGIIDDVVNNGENNVTSVDWNGVTINIKKTISIEEACSFVDTIVSVCFKNEGYRPELLEPARRLCILNTYAGMSINSLDDRSYKLLYDTDLMEVVLKNINRNQLNDIISAADMKLTYEVDVENNTLRNEMEELKESFTKLGNIFEDTFSNISPDDIATITKAVENGDVDYDKLARSYIKVSNEKK